MHKSDAVEDLFDKSKNNWIDKPAQVDNNSFIRAMTMDYSKTIFNLIHIYVITLYVHHVTADYLPPSDKQDVKWDALF